MKVLRIILIVLGILIAVFLVLSIFAPNEFSAEESVLIDAPRPMVFSSVNNLEKWEHWEPWREADTAATFEFSDTVSGVGAWYRWEGDQVGKGKLTLSESRPFEEIDLELDFYERGTADSKFMFSDSSGMTSVRWDFYTEEGFPGNVFMWLMGAEQMIADSYRKGLDSLKAHTEGLVDKKYRGFTIEHDMYPGNIFLGVRKIMTMDRMKDFFSSAYTHTSIAINKNDLKMAGPPAGLYFTWDEEAGTTELMAGIPVQSKPSQLPDTTLTVLEVPESKALMIEYLGAYESLGDAHFAMEDYIKATGMEMKSPVIEEYVTDPAMVPDTSNWQTNIYYLLKGGQ